MQTIKKLLSQLFVLFSLVAAINAVMVIAYPLGQINDWPRFLLTEGALNSQEEWEDFTSNCLGSYWQVEDDNIYISCETVFRHPAFHYVFSRYEFEKYSGINFFELLSTNNVNK